MAEICLALAAETIEENLKLLEEYKSSITMLELRVDCLKPSEYNKVGKFPKMTRLPVILTIRRKSDGGKIDIDELSRATLLFTLFNDSLFNKKPFAYIDLEDDFDNSMIENIFVEWGVNIIRSFHDFNGVPVDLAERMKALKKGPNDIPKAAVMPKTIQDCLRMYKAGLELEGTRKILIGMGSMGFHTRVLADKFGSFLTFCSPSVSNAAPGHVDPHTLADTYRLMEIDSNSDVYGIIGNPVMHTKSPYIHNPAFRRADINAVYVPFEVDNLSGFLEYAEALNVKGLSVTIPFKEDVIRSLKKTDTAVKKIKSCNTIKRIGRQWEGINTDYYGFIAPLKELSEYKDIEDKKALVIGAGGAARSAVFALQEEGFKVLVINRTVEKAKKFHEEFGCEYASLNMESLELIKNYSSLIVQTTSVGMHPYEDSDPLGFYKFTGKELVYDIIYNPQVTKILARAEKSGCKVLNGMKMLECQAWKQFEYFTGQKFPEA